MKRFLHDRRGTTLIELITCIAVLSIVAFSAFTLLMFSIRTNSFIVNGSALSRDSDLLNDRLSLLLREAAIDVSDDRTSVGLNAVNNDGTSEEKSVGMLCLDGEELVYYPDKDNGDKQVLQDRVTAFEVTVIEEGGTLLRIEYTLDDSYTCTKIFSCVSCISSTVTPDG